MSEESFTCCYWNWPRKKFLCPEKSASFVQVYAICTYEKTLFVTDVAVGTIRLVTSLSKTVSFLKNLGCFYDTFGIHEKGTPAKKVTLREAKENVNKVCSEVQRQVASVKERRKPKIVSP